MIQDRFKSSLSGSSNKFSYLSLALKSNTILDPKVEIQLHTTNTKSKKLMPEFRIPVKSRSSVLRANPLTSSLGAQAAQLLGNRDSSPHALSHCPDNSNPAQTPNLVISPVKHSSKDGALQSILLVRHRLRPVGG